MSRSDGSFPRYAKLAVDTESWPKDYWDSSLQCPACSIRWPNDKHFSTTVCCHKPAVKSDSPPEMRWPDALSELFHARFETLYDEYNEGKSDADLSWEDLKSGKKLDGEKVDKAIDDFVEDARKDRAS